MALCGAQTFPILIAFIIFVCKKKKNKTSILNLLIDLGPSQAT